MILRVAVAILALISGAFACSCRPGVTVQQKAAAANVVFRGTIVEIRDVQRDPVKHIIEGRKRIVVFRVGRVWKGVVNQQFEMPFIENPGGICRGFSPGLVAVGNELLVYASRLNLTGDYATSLCNHALISKSSKDLRELGAGREPAIGSLARP